MSSGFGGESPACVACLEERVVQFEVLSRGASMTMFVTGTSPQVGG
jgi:hypothetical protein